MQLSVNIVYPNGVSIVVLFLLSISKGLEQFWMQDSVRHFDLRVH